jgi:hypothetical protein
MRSSIPARRRVPARTTAGSRSASATAIVRCTRSATPTRSRPGRATNRASASLSADCTAWVSGACSAARACSAGKAMPRRWRWPGWSRPCAGAMPRCSTASFPQATSPRWARWRSRRSNISRCWKKPCAIRWCRRRRLPRPALRRPGHRHRRPRQARSPCSTCPQASPRSWPMRPMPAILPRQGTSSRSP